MEEDDGYIGGEDMPIDDGGGEKEDKKVNVKNNKRDHIKRDEIDKCPKCGGLKMITDYKHGEIICTGCGYVIKEELFDFGPEWRSFDEDQKEKRSRTGGLVKFAKLGKGLTTEIDKYDRDIRGGSIQPERRAQLYRLRKWQRRARMSDSVHRNLSIALPELDRMSSYLYLSNKVQEECARWYRKAVAQGLVRGRSIESVIAALIYMVSRQQLTPKTLDELSKAAGVGKKEIGRTYRFLCRNLKIKMPVITAVDYVSRFSSVLGVSGVTEAKAIELLKTAVVRGATSGRAPMGVAAAGIFIAAQIVGEKLTQEMITEKLEGLSEITIRNRAIELKKELGIDIPQMTTISGIVTAGVGEGKRYILAYQLLFEEVIGIIPFPGTLNVKVERISDLAGLIGSGKYFIKGFEKDGKLFGDVDVISVELVSGMQKIDAYAVFPSIKSAGSQPGTIEIVSEVNLRERLCLKNGDIVKIRSKGLLD